MRDQVHGLTGGEAVDLVMDQLGGDVFDACLRPIKPGGGIAVVDFALGRVSEVQVK